MYMYPIVCIHSSVLLQLTWFPVLIVVPTGPKSHTHLFERAISLKILVVSTWLSQPHPSPNMRHSPLGLQGWNSSPREGGCRELTRHRFFSFPHADPMLEYSRFIVLCLLSVYSTRFSIDIYIQDDCSSLDSFPIEFTAEGQAKFHMPICTTPSISFTLSGDILMVVCLGYGK